MAEMQYDCKTIRVMMTLINLVELKNPFLSGHSERVAEYATLLASELGLSQGKVLGIRLAGLLHDLGKLTLPDEILDKPSRLSDSEMSIVRKHPQGAADVLRPILQAGHIVEAVASHHERWDGNGYPARLSGTEIPFGGRILGVADAFDAMTSARPYRPPLTIAEALNEIQANSGTQFDPHVASAFIRLVRAGMRAGHGKGSTPGLGSIVGVDAANGAGRAYLSARAIGSTDATNGRITLQANHRADMPAHIFRPGQVVNVAHTAAGKSFRQPYCVVSQDHSNRILVCEPVGEAEGVGVGALAGVRVSIPAKYWLISRDTRQKATARTPLDVTVREVGPSAVAYEPNGCQGYQAPCLYRPAIGLEVMLEFHLPLIGEFEGGNVEIKARILADPFHPILGAQPLYWGRILEADRVTDELLRRFVFAAKERESALA